MYQVLARRWRPQRFEDLVGQEVVVRSLRHALESGEVAHAYLFSGLRGVGKTTAARLLAKALNCEKGPTAEPCGECVACTEIATGRALDVLEIDAASNTGIDDVRELRDIVLTLPIRDRFRVVILDEAHQLSKAAFNGLLKILEEPPAHVIFILASTEKQKFPATILSRCQQLDFRPIPQQLITDRLAAIAAADGFAATPGALQLVARAAEGSLRDALSLLDRVRAFGAGAVDEASVAEVLGIPPLDATLALFAALEAGDVGRALGLLREAEQTGRDLVSLYDELLDLLHALLLLASEPGVPLRYPEEQRPAFLEAAARLGLPQLVRLLGMAAEQRSLVAGSDRPALAVAVAVGRLCLWPRLVRVERLLAGETTVPAQALPVTGPPPRARAATKTPPPQVVSQGSEETMASKLFAALTGVGAHTLAARVRKADEVVVADGALVVRFRGVPTATVAQVREALAEVAKAAAIAGLPTEVRVESADAPAALAAPAGLRERIEKDERVQKVISTFGGRINGVEELP